ncbi:TolC family protein [Aquifex sp.]
MILFFLVLFTFGFSIELSLKDAIELALKNNRELRKFERILKSRNYQEKLRLIERFSPKLELSADKDELRLTARLLLLEFGRRVHAIKAEKYRKLLAEEYLKEFRNLLQLEVAKLYVKIQLLEYKTQELRERMAIAYVRFDRERQKEELGLSDPVKVAEKETIYRRYRYELFKAQKEYNEALYRLKRYMGVELTQDITLKPIDFKVKENLTLDEQKLLKFLSQNFKLRQKSLEIAYYRELEKGESNLYKPEVYLRGRLRQSFEGDSRTDLTTIVNVPLFDPTVRFRVKSIKEKRMSLLFEKEYMAQQVKERILTFPYIWEELLERFRFAKTNMNWAELNLDLKRSQYELELTFDVGYAMADYTKAEYELLKAKTDLLLLLMEVYHTVGLEPIKALEGNYEFFKERIEF